MEDQLPETSSSVSIIDDTTAIDNGTTSFPFDRDLPFHPWNEASRRMFNFSPQTILLSGIFGNVMILIILYRLKSSESSLDIFFWALPVSDSCVLLCTVLRRVVIEHFHTDYMASHRAVCKISSWMLYVSGRCRPGCWWR